jgi:hypothetical protein
MSFTDVLVNNIQSVYHSVLKKRHPEGVKGKTLNCDSFLKIADGIKNVIGDGLNKGLGVFEITNNIIFDIINKNYFVYENIEMAALIGYIYLKRQDVTIKNYSMKGLNNNSTLDDIKKITDLW